MIDTNQVNDGSSSSIGTVNEMYENYKKYNEDTKMLNPEVDLTNESFRKLKITISLTNVAAINDNSSQGENFTSAQKIKQSNYKIKQDSLSKQSPEQCRKPFNAK